jgi:hypothetical protein
MHITSTPTADSMHLLPLGTAAPEHQPTVAHPFLIVTRALQRPDLTLAWNIDLAGAPVVPQLIQHKHL